MTAKKLSVADKLVLAMNLVEKETGRGVSAEELVVRAWKEYPDTFGLRGIVGADGSLAYPDSNRVFAEIMGSKPLRARGLIEKTAGKTYRLTSTGRTLAETLQGVDEGVQRANLTREEMVRLQRQLASRARSKFTAKDFDAISFTDACSFWGITSGVSNSRFESRRSDVLGLVSRGRAVLGDSPQKAVDNSGKVVIAAADLDSLVAVDDFLCTTFAKELAVIRARRDER